MNSRKLRMLQSIAVCGMDSRKVRMQQSRTIVEWIPEKKGFYRAVVEWIPEK